ncbi:MAG: alpha/beta hydrolase [Alphaproteobacteria bacterium]|nr:alpha/beta hydrolase [Alphaproteobacteria bacterium]
MKLPHSIRIGTQGMPDVVFGHGWGRSHHDFIPVAEAIAPFANSLLLDLPGFGMSEPPEEAWGSRDYATYLVRYLKNHLGLKEFMWVGHSFGGRIGLCLASHQDSGIRHLLIVAGAGLPCSLPLSVWLRNAYRLICFRLARHLVGSGTALIALEERYGSPDYVQSRSLGLRDVFLHVVSENLLPEINRVHCPSTLIYGEGDIVTPPEIGRRFHRLIPDSVFIECPVFDHFSILSRGKHQIALAVREGLA